MRHDGVAAVLHCVSHACDRLARHYVLASAHGRNRYQQQTAGAAGAACTLARLVSCAQPYSSRASDRSRPAAAMT